MIVIVRSWQHVQWAYSARPERDAYSRNFTHLKATVKTELTPCRPLESPGPKTMQ
jgi:hypothetical protein